MQMPPLLPLGYAHVSEVSWHGAPAKPPQSPRTGMHAFSMHSRPLAHVPHAVPIAPHVVASFGDAESPHAAIITSNTNRMHHDYHYRAMQS